jgi:hypothetical protein
MKLEKLSNEAAVSNVVDEIFDRHAVNLEAFRLALEDYSLLLVFERGRLLKVGIQLLLTDGLKFHQASVSSAN